MSSDHIDSAQRIIYLLSKKLKHPLSKEEEEEIQSWKKISSKNEKLFQELTTGPSVRFLLKELQKYNVERSIDRLKHQMVRHHTKRRWSYYVVAASIILAIGLGALMSRYHDSFYELYRNDIQPGQYVAQLTLPDGSSIALDSMQIGETASRNGMVITKSGNGKISCNYSASGIDQPETNQPPNFNTISTPLGGEYQVILPDGSTVWLNANSTLKFPSQFQKSERYIELIGEGYFEIKNNDHAPFKVAVNKQIITVLGTKFNVLAYHEEDIIRTTLLEGAIKISTSKSNHILKPGQEARVHKDSEHMEVFPGDINEAIAWKNGYFIFNNENIKTIMQKVSRWYNVEVVYEGDVNEIAVGGMFSKTKSLQKLLKSFQSTGQIRYKIIGRRVIIMPE